MLNRRLWVTAAILFAAFFMPAIAAAQSWVAPNTVTAKPVILVDPATGLAYAASGGGGGGATTPFTVLGNTSLNANTSSANVALPGSGFAVVVVTNTGTVPVYVVLGIGSGTTATTANTYIGAGQVFSFAAGANTHLAAIAPTAAVNQTLTIATGTGTPSISSAGGTVTVASGSITVASGSINIAGTTAISASSLPLAPLASTSYAQASTTSGQTTALGGAAVYANPPTFTAGQTDPLIEAPSGALGIGCISLAGAWCDFTAPGAAWLTYPSTAAVAGASATSSGNTAITATMAAVAAKTNYLCDVEVTGSGSTAGLVVAFTITGLAEGTKTYTFTAPVGVLVGAYPLIFHFPACKAASAQNVAIAGALAALGAGNTSANIDLGGFVQ